MFIKITVFLVAFFYLGIVPVKAESVDPSASAVASPQASPSAIAAVSSSPSASPSVTASASVVPSVSSSPSMTPSAIPLNTQKASASIKPSVTVSAQTTKKPSPTPSPSPSASQPSPSPLPSLEAKGSFLPIELGNGGGNAMGGNVLDAKDVVAGKPTNLLTHVMIVVLFGILLTAGMYLSGKRPAFIQNFLQRSGAQDKKSNAGKMRSMSDLR